MNFSRPARRITAWIACFAILLASLAPSVSHALAAAKGSPVSLVEICSTTGTKFVRVADAGNLNPSSPAEPAMVKSEHCPFCLTHAGSFGLPPAAAFAFPVAKTLPAFPALFYQASGPLFVWTSPQSRAPPHAS